MLKKVLLTKQKQKKRGFLKLFFEGEEEKRIN